MRPAKAPRCFGSPTAFQSKSEICGKCNFKTACGKDAGVMVDELRDVLGIKKFTYSSSVIPDFRRAKEDATSKKEIQSKQTEKPKEIEDTKKAKDVQDVQEKPEGLSKNAFKLATRLNKLDIDFQKELSDRRNPCAGEKPAYMDAALDVLIKRGSVTSRDLKDHYMRTFSWREGAASSHASFVLPALAYIGAVARDGKAFMIQEKT